MRIVTILVLCAVIVTANRRKTKRKIKLPPDLPKWCLQPKKVGMCRAAFANFYFDKDSGSCKPFVYGGCGGNENNFENLDDCEQTCHPAVREKCNCRSYAKPFNQTERQHPSFRKKHRRRLGKLKLCMEVCVYVKMTNWQKSFSKRE